MGRRGDERGDGRWEVGGGKGGEELFSKVGAMGPGAPQAGECQGPRVDIRRT